MSAAEQKIVEHLRTDFFRVARHDAVLATALQAFMDMVIEGDFFAAAKLNEIIARRLELLAMSKQFKIKNSKLKIP